MQRGTGFDSLSEALIQMTRHPPWPCCVCRYASHSENFFRRKCTALELSLSLSLSLSLYLCLSPSFSYLHVYADGKLRHSAESGLKMVNKKGRARSTNFSCPFSPPSLCSPRGLGWVRFRISVDWDHFRDFLFKYINPCSPDPIPSNVSEAKIVRTQVRYGFAQLA